MLKKIQKAILIFLLITVSPIVFIWKSGENRMTKIEKLDFISDNIKNGAIERNAKYEASFSFSGKFENPYNPDEVELNAFFTLPDRTKVTIPGFWYEGFERKLCNRKEQLTRNGIKAWKIRYTPRIVGRYEYYIELEDKIKGKTYRYPEEGLISFESEYSENKGFLRVSATDVSFLEFDNGSPFIGIGHNLCGWEWGGTDNSKGTYEYDEWLLNMHNNKANMTQFDFCEGDQIEWTNHPDELPFSNDWNGLNLYNQQNAWKMDHRIQRAEELGIYYRLTLLHWEDFDKEDENFPDWGWNRNPYNKLNGGPVENVTEFFKDEKSKKYVKKMIRYIVARWGYSKNLIAYELWNEVDSPDIVWGKESNYDKANSAIIQWHEEMATYIKSIDPNDHLITTSFSQTTNGNSIWRLKNIDLTTIHRYTFFNPDYRDEKYETIETLNKLITARRENTGKPILVGEFALSPGGDIQKDFDINGIAFHNQIWVSVLSKSVGTAMHWTWGSYIHDYNLYYHYKPLGIFTADEDFRNLMLFNNFSDDNSNIRYIGLKGQNKAYIWIQDRNNDFDAIKNGYVPELIKGCTIQIFDMEKSDYIAEYYDTYSGQIVMKSDVKYSGEGLDVIIPDFKRDIAVKIKKKSDVVEWISRDIPSIKRSSLTEVYGERMRIKACGAEIGGMMDDFRYVYQKKKGDFEITARIDYLTNLSEYAKTGLMIREMELQNSRFAYLCINPTARISFGYRSDGLATYSPWKKFKFYGYLKLVRKDEKISAYISYDSSKWEEVDFVRLEGINDEVLVGIATTSKNPITYVTSEYSNIEIK